MSTNNGLSSPTRSLKTRFARRFLQSLIRMKRNRPTSSSSSSSLRNIQGRSQVIKIASYSSMARVVGSKRAWSRDFIFKIRRSRVRHQGLVVKRRCRYGVVSSSSSKRALSRRSSLSSIVKKNKKAVGEKTPSTDPSQFDKLRGLIPGGEKMELCNLLEETAHYIKCLGTQVKVMEKMADALSSSST